MLLLNRRPQRPHRGYTRNPLPTSKTVERAAAWPSGFSRQLGRDSHNDLNDTDTEIDHRDYAKCNCTECQGGLTASRTPANGQALENADRAKTGGDTDRQE